MTITNFTPAYLNALISEATKSPRLRQHQNIHTSYQDPCQRFMNAFGVDSYMRPHRHLLDPKAETLIAIQGLFALVTFDDEGVVQEIIHFGTEKYSGPEGLSVGADLPPETWHTIIARVPDAVLLELKAGPYDQNAAKETAPWAPEEQTPEGNDFLIKLKSLVDLT
jgi:cupin fold WbuC family metalloprotein